MNGIDGAGAPSEPDAMGQQLAVGTSERCSLIYYMFGASDTLESAVVP